MLKNKSRETETEKENWKTARERESEAKAQHPQTYGCLLLDYTSAGWKITSSLSLCVCVCVYTVSVYILHMVEHVCVSKTSQWSLLKIIRYHLTSVHVRDVFKIAKALLGCVYVCVCAICVCPCASKMLSMF